ncbi:hypothetical protein L6452_36347 [Arctium lappa]|uniref:Uncharacterized protein n=1 Tax=Arctium lappa TaxID=4217 RepID=A0ACB8YD53_ARCLA|nr:hypothetical protein L6452_36347 [Arctium lappa]
MTPSSDDDPCLINLRSSRNFFQRGLVRQEHYLEELLSAFQSCDKSCDEELGDLIARVLEHYQHYYDEKS